MSAWDLEPVDDFSGWSVERRLRHLVSWAVLAPNAHNAQPWAFELSLGRREISIGIEPGALMRHSDEHSRQAVIGLGCAFENLCCAARLYGWQGVEELVAPLSFDDGRPFARLRIIEFGVGEPLQHAHRAVFAAMRTRRMNRSKYTQQPLLHEFKQKLATCVDAPLELHLIEDTVTRVALSELQYIADRAVVALPSFRAELGSHLLLNEDTATETGMPGHTLGLGDDATRDFKAELARGGLLNPRWATGLASADRDGLRSAPLIVALSVPSDEAPLWFHTGRVLVRMAVLAEEHGVAIACNAAMVESRALNRMLKLRLGCSGRPTAVFRVGYASEPRQHAPRKPEQQVVRIVDASTADRLKVDAK